MAKAPGPQQVIAGDKNYGFFGEVPVSELWSGDELSNLLDITQGTLQYSNEPWLKFVLDGKIIYKSKKTFRHSISWDHLNEKGVVYGDKIIKDKNGNHYKIRLIKGALTDPSKDGDPDKGAKYSEWNKLMMPIHERAKNKNWNYLRFIEGEVPNDWNINYTDKDLITDNAAGNGSYHWCQETLATSPTNRMCRGFNDISYVSDSIASAVNSSRAWSPVLELITPPSTHHITDDKETVKYTLVDDAIVKFTEKDDDFPELSLPINTEIIFTKLVDYDTKEETEINHTLPSFFKDRHDGKMRIVQQDAIEEEFEEAPHEIVTTCFTDHLSELLQHDDVKIYAFTEEYDDFQVNFKHTPSSALLLANGDIGIKAVDNIDFFQLDSTELGEAKVKMIVSVNEGKSWNTYDGGWSRIEPTVDEVTKFGTPKEVFNTIPPAAWNDLRKKSDKIRFGYLINYSEVEDKAVIKAMNAQFDMTGTWKAAVHGKDFEYEYPDNSTIVVKLLTNGDYKMNY